MNSLAPRYFALIPAAGVGARMAASGPKQYLKIGGKPMLRHAIDAFLFSELIAHTYVVVSPDDPVIDSIVPSHGVTVLRCGGATRAESVQNGLAALNGTLRENDWVLVHDAARPGLDEALIEKLITHTGEHPVGGVLALPVVDTVKRCIAGEVGTVSREGMWLAQTPQMFRYKLLRDALSAARDMKQITDDASAVEALGLSPKLVEGDPRNLKVTLPGDIRIAEMYLATTQPAFL
ncbi:2-C-methyl-D-erythritol 4-phosphate cytidylyltransferase [Massilia sp. YIM B02769]|jgi:2-C-methyl-D-erythritol 4-phosphate cytidylyltransferase|uniref:2-C-methyl-D-erythritol 4-phosphate cytidylyltransferase n=1 Tax=unclassified Massilia TaxID=2609279 RepID=UPI0025B6CB49|nr:MULTISPECIES: 2-C-methyl-D-erythritol 4-phosphate cytidylyltransferase [unclassified Massilia]MDN4058754.1 2-C-methyl-D-erythritol 4-phosphate cytidylyltransferase [Massilia sp. YIM B02769]